MAAEPQTATLFQNVRVFDGRMGAVSAPSHVLVEGPTITRISAAPFAADADRPVAAVAGDGRVLMPGLIDAHWHVMFAAMPLALTTSADIGYLNLLAARQAEATLMRGFTAVRDMGGRAFGLKRAI